jgi:DNA-binding transcriptional ArsR family regulator
MSRNLDATLAALADPTRRTIIELLQQKPLCPSEVADTLHMSRPAMSRHLRILRGAGLIEQESTEGDARVRVIHLRRAPFTELRGWVENVEAFWQDQLAAFKAHAERVAGGAITALPATAPARTPATPAAARATARRTARSPIKRSR